MPLVCPQLRAGGFTAQSLESVGFSTAQLRTAGFRARQIKSCSGPGKMAAVFSLGELKADGFGIKELRDEEGYDLAEYAAPAIELET